VRSEDSRNRRNLKARKDNPNEMISQFTKWDRIVKGGTLGRRSEALKDGLVDGSTRERTISTGTQQLVLLGMQKEVRENHWERRQQQQEQMRALGIKGTTRWDNMQYGGIGGQSDRGHLEYERQTISTRRSPPPRYEQNIEILY